MTDLVFSQSTHDATVPNDRGVDEPGGGTVVWVIFDPADSIHLWKQKKYTQPQLVSVVAVRQSFRMSVSQSSLSQSITANKGGAFCSSWFQLLFLVF